MPQINIFLAYLVRPHWMFYIVVGIALTALFSTLIEIPTKGLGPLLSTYVGLPVFLSFLCKTWACQFFYAEKYNSYISSLAIPSKDIYFLDTISSDIGFPSKDSWIFLCFIESFRFFGDGIFPSYWFVYFYKLVMNKPTRSTRVAK